MQKHDAELEMVDQASRLASDLPTALQAWSKKTAPPVLCNGQRWVAGRPTNVFQSHARASCQSEVRTRGARRDRMQLALGSVGRYQ
jgi:hypothetical protein